MSVENTIVVKRHRRSSGTGEPVFIGDQQIILAPVNLPPPSPPGTEVEILLPGENQPTRLKVYSEVPSPPPTDILPIGSPLELALRKLTDITTVTALNVGRRQVRIVSITRPE